MKTAGVVLDFYDDSSGTLLKKAFPTLESLPECIKTAHILNPEERGVLRDEAYALILHNEGTTLRKYACVDAGNTLLSCLYFEENADALPEEAIKVAAAVLLDHCEEFGLRPSAFLKMASGGTKKPIPVGSAMGRKRDPMMQPIVGDEADWAARTNLVSPQGGADSGRVIPTANQMKTAGLGTKKEWKQTFSSDPKVRAEQRAKNKERHEQHYKTAEELGGGMVLTNDKRAIGVNAKNPPQQQTKTQLPDTNAFSTGQGKGDVEVNPKETKWPSEKTASLISVYVVKGDNGAPVILPRNTVNVSGKSAKASVHKTASVRYAIADRYPLDSYADVQKAVGYFQDNWTQMDPASRHEYCVKTASRADELGIPISETMGRYGSVNYAPDLEAHLANRKANCAAEFHPMFDDLHVKHAQVEPEVFASLLMEADHHAGLNVYWGGPVADPYLATFGGLNEKQASSLWCWQSAVGDMCSADQLKKLAINGRPLIHKHFSSDLTTAFCEDPIGIFESLPDTQKTLLARMASDEFYGLPTN